MSLRLLLLAALPALAGWPCAADVLVTGDAGDLRGTRGPVLGELPQFPRQRTTAGGVRGGVATLQCRVLHQGGKAVSWVRSRDLQILSYAGNVFTTDARVSLPTDGDDDDDDEDDDGGDNDDVTRHRLRISRLRASDAGRYECQLNTEPKMSLFFNLTVLDSPEAALVARVSGSAASEAGGAARLACEGRLEPPSPAALPVRLHWLRDDTPLSSQSTRGGVSVETERWAGGGMSRLVVGALSEADAGPYCCVARAGDLRARDCLTLSVLSQPTEAMQRDQAARAAAHNCCYQQNTALLLTLLIALLT